MYKITTTKQFDKGMKRCEKRGYPMEKLKHVLTLLVRDGKLPSTYRPHKLSGNHDGEWEAHITSDWLLTWYQDDTQLVLLMLATGSHSDLFGKTKR